MRNSFVLFDVSKEITLGQFRSRESGNTHKNVLARGQTLLTHG